MARYIKRFGVHPVHGGKLEVKDLVPLWGCLILHQPRDFFSENRVLGLHLRTPNRVFIWTSFFGLHEVLLTQMTKMVRPGSTDDFLLMRRLRPAAASNDVAMSSSEEEIRFFLLVFALNPVAF